MSHRVALPVVLAIVPAVKMLLRMVQNPMMLTGTPKGDAHGINTHPSGKRCGDGHLANGTDKGDTHGVYEGGAYEATDDLCEDSAQNNTPTATDDDDPDEEVVNIDTRTIDHDWEGQVRVRRM
jgi:hypothetical protein